MIFQEPREEEWLQEVKEAAREEELKQQTATLQNPTIRMATAVGKED